MRDVNTRAACVFLRARLCARACLLARCQSMSKRVAVASLTCPVTTIYVETGGVWRVKFLRSGRVHWRLGYLGEGTSEKKGEASVTLPERSRAGHQSRHASSAYIPQAAQPIKTVFYTPVQNGAV